MKTVSFLLSALSAAALVSAHATWQELTSGSTDYAGTCVRTVASNSPVTSVSSTDLACNVNGNNPAASKCPVTAGGSVTVEMHQQPGDRSCSNEAIGGNHDGPVIIYMAKVSDAATAIGSQVGWFKVAQAGLVSPGSGAATDGVWGTDNLNKNCGKYTFTVPKDIQNGDYLIRAEVIALHVAGSVGGAQLYMSCFQVTVSGGGNAAPATVKFPGAYSATDPGILYDLYANPAKPYTVPGPTVYGGGGPPASTGTTKPASSSSTKTSAQPTPTCSVAKYGQCGGQGYTGCTFCASGSTCTASNQYYSQCL